MLATVYGSAVHVGQRGNFHSGIKTGAENQFLSSQIGVEILLPLQRFLLAFGWKLLKSLINWIGAKEEPHIALSSQLCPLCLTASECVIYLLTHLRVARLCGIGCFFW